MAERIVVSLRVRKQDPRAPDERSELERARFLLKRAEAMGAAVCSWGPATASFAFAPEDLEDAIEFIAGEEASVVRQGMSAGIAQGEQVVLLELRGAVELARGQAVSRSLALARIARVGEVLVDSDLEAVARGDLLTSGSRRAILAGQELRGQLLDVDEPWRSAADRMLDQVRTPPLLGRAAAMKQAAVAPGVLTIVRAEPGMGGTRFLREYLASTPGRRLYVSPAGFTSEPLGALRKAIARSIEQSGMVNLPHAERTVLEAVVDGRGADIALTAYLLEEWLAPPGESAPGMIAVDDAAEVDAATLDVIATSLLGATRPFRCVARLDASSPLPAQFAPLPPGPEVELKTLTRPDAEKLVASMLGQTGSAPWIQEWAHRGAGVPQAIHEAVLEAIASGELSMSAHGVKVRPRSIPRGRVMAAGDWIARRWAMLEADARSVLCAVAVLGGDAPSALVESLLQASADAPVDLETIATQLVARGWLVEPQEQWLALPSRSHLRAVLEGVPDSRRPAWHRAASLVIEASDGVLARAEAARQASLSSDRSRAARLYAEASKAASAALLEESALELLAMARSEDPKLTREIESAWPGSESSGDTPSFHAPPSSFAAALVQKAHEEQRSSYPPVELPSGAGAALQQSAGVSPPVIPKAPPIPSVDSVRAAPRPVTAPRPHLDSVPEITIGEALPEPRAPMVSILPPDFHVKVKAVDEMAARLPLLAREALSAKDMRPLDELAGREPMTGERQRVIDRVRAMVALNKGERSEALRVLRDACLQADKCGLIEQSRSHLALAVGLAQTGSALEALVEAIEALARAREAADKTAESACLHFIRKVYEASGHATDAASWVA